MNDKDQLPSPEGPVQQFVLPWKGKLRHDRGEFADWGWIRDESEAIIFVVKPSCHDEIFLGAHRRNGTDPTQARVDALLAALNGQNARCAATAGLRHEKSWMNYKTP